MTLAGVSATAETQRTPERFEVTTTNMMPADRRLEIQVLEWSDESNRAEIVATLASESDVGRQLDEKPTLGYVWVDGSSVGYTLKYAHRTTSEDGRERATFVTNRPLGSYDLEPWRVAGKTVGEDREYSVIEIDLADGSGILSPGAAVVLDEENGVVALERDGGAQPVLAGAGTASKPFWAREAGE